MGSGAAWLAGALGVALGVELVFAGKAHARGSRQSRESRDPDSAPPPPLAGPIAPPPPRPISYPSGIPMGDTQYTTATWIPIVGSIIATSYPRVSLPFAMKWIEIESGGNPCSVGDPGQLGPDQQPAEIGIGQLYNPDDFRTFGQNPAAYRAYAPAAAPLAADYRAAQAQLKTAIAAGDTAQQTIAKSKMGAAARQMQSRTRPLSSQEMDAQARWTLLAKIDQGMYKADQVVATYSLSHWSVPDYWKLVKAPHALPAILNSGMPAVVKKLGRAPTSWAEFRATLGMDGQSQWKRALDACEACGNAVAPAVS